MPVRGEVKVNSVSVFVMCVPLCYVLSVARPSSSPQVRFTEPLPGVPWARTTWAVRTEAKQKKNGFIVVKELEAAIGDERFVSSSFFRRKNERLSTHIGRVCAPQIQHGHLLNLNLRVQVLMGHFVGC